MPFKCILVEAFSLLEVTGEEGGGEVISSQQSASCLRLPKSSRYGALLEGLTSGCATGARGQSLRLAIVKGGLELPWAFQVLDLPRTSGVEHGAKCFYARTSQKINQIPH